MNKKTLRTNILEKRSLLNKKEIKDKSQSIMNSLLNLDAYKNAQRIMTFVSMEKEVDTHPLIQQIISHNKSVVVPITVNKTKELLLSDLFSLSELEIGDYDIEIPKTEFTRLVDPKTVDLILVPGLAFAKDGHRVGYGGGYYDRFLEKIDKSVPKIGIAFDLQIVDKVPVEPFDIGVDLIITEKRILNC